MQLTTTIIAIVSLMAVIAAITMYASKYTRLPFTVLLVVAGYLFSHIAMLSPPPFNLFANYKVDPDIILFACLPTLIFESAFTMDPRLFKRNLFPILTLAIPGLFLSTAIIGLIVWALTSLNLLVALLLGAILSATDPVAVIALFKQLGVPKRLTILVEGESLLNDSTAIVTAKTILFMISAATITGSTFYHGAQEFCIEFFGGIFVGIIMTYVTGWMIEMADDETIVGLSLTIVLAYLSFLVADKVFHVSGVMATISAGLMMAGWGRTKLNSQAQEQLHDLLGFLAYIVNAMIFLLVGFSISLGAFINDWWLLAVTILAMLLSRAIVIYGMMPLVGKVPGAEKIDYRYQTIMWWGGLRGAIALAIVFGLNELPDQSVLANAVMAAVLFTIMVQGLSVNKLIHWLKLDKPLLIDRLARIEAELAADESALKQIPILQSGGLFSLSISQRLQTAEKKSIEAKHQELEHLKAKSLNLDEERKLLFLRCYSVEKQYYYELFDKGNLSEQVYKALNQHIEHKIDLMRYHARETEKSAFSIKEVIIRYLQSAGDHFSVMTDYRDRIRVTQMINEYEEAWGRYQGCYEVLNCLKTISEIESISENIVSEVEKCFNEWLSTAKDYLDKMAEQFPEFVHDMQHRLAVRMVTYAKCDVIEDEVHKGLLPVGVTDALLVKYRHKLKRLKRRRPDKLKLDPYELVYNVPFLKYIPSSEIQVLISLLKEVHYPSGVVIVHEGEVEEVMYFILRGVVRVVKLHAEKEVEVATLIAGDYFGEMALVFETARSASCRTVSPCVLYTLDKKTFKLFMQKYPDIFALMVREADKRKSDLNSLK